MMASNSEAQRRTTTRSREGFFEPFSIDDVRVDDIVVFPKTGKARIRATGKTVPLSELQ
jgi:hypothetical protein